MSDDKEPDCDTMSGMAGESKTATDGVTVHVYTVCWNEQQMMPYFLRHYSAFAERIVVYDNMSTDCTRQIVESWPTAELRTFDTNQELNDVEQTRIKNTAYMESRGRADFVIVVDSDEFIYHPELQELLSQYKREGITLPKTRGFDMVSWRFPTAESQLTDLVDLGRKRSHYSKRSIFNPELEINFSIGSHECKPVGNVVESEETDLFLLHFHYVGLLRCVRRHRMIRARLGEWYKSRPNAAAQYRWGSARVVAQFVKSRLKSHHVLSERPSLITELIAPVVGLGSALRRRLAA